MVKKNNNIIKVVSYLLVLLILVGIIGCIAFLTNNFTQEPATMLVQVNGQLVKGNVDSIVFQQVPAMDVGRWVQLDECGR